MVEEIRRQEDPERHTKAITVAKQGQGTNWLNLEKKKKLSWCDIWEMEEPQLSRKKKKTLVFPPDIVITKLRPGVVLWSTTAKLAYFEEITVQQV